MRLVLPLILIGVGITIIVMFINPTWTELAALRAEGASYDEALGNSKALGYARDDLTQKHSLIPKENLDKLAKLLPENVDNIRLILEIEQLATPYGMAIRNVQYDVGEESSANVATTKKKESRKEYGTIELEFTTSGSYSNFVKFLKDLENNLRIVDISSVSFSSNIGSVIAKNAVPSDSYEYVVRIKTYWLKN